MPHPERHHRQPKWGIIQIVVPGWAALDNIIRVGDQSAYQLEGRRGGESRGRFGQAGPGIRPCQHPGRLFCQHIGLGFDSWAWLSAKRMAKLPNWYPRMMSSLKRMMRVDCQISRRRFIPASNAHHAPPMRNVAIIVQVRMLATRRSGPRFCRVSTRRWDRRRRNQAPVLSSRMFVLFGWSLYNTSAGRRHFQRWH